MPALPELTPENTAFWTGGERGELRIAFCADCERAIHPQPDDQGAEPLDAVKFVILAVVILHWSTDTVGTLERRFYDFASTSSGRQPSDRIAIIAIDDQSIANIGRWPWPRDVHAQLIDRLAGAKAKTIVYTTFFFEPQADRGLVFIRKIKEALGPGAEGAGGVERGTGERATDHDREEQGEADAEAADHADRPVAVVERVQVEEGGRARARSAPSRTGRRRPGRRRCERRHRRSSSRRSRRGAPRTARPG